MKDKLNIIRLTLNNSILLFLIVSFIMALIVLLSVPSQTISVARYITIISFMSLIVIMFIYVFIIQYKYTKVYYYKEMRRKLRLKIIKFITDYVNKHSDIIDRNTPIYVSEEIFKVVSIDMLMNYNYNFFEDKDRNGLEVGLYKRKELINNVEEFFN